MSEEAGGTGHSFEEAYRIGKEKWRRLRRIRLVLTLTLPVVVLGFSVAIYANARSMYRPEAFAPHVKAEVQELTPKLAVALREAADEVVPVYRDRLAERLPHWLPEFRDKATEEFQVLLGTLDGFAKTEVQQAMDRVNERHAERLRARFPELSTERGREVLKTRWHQAVEDDTADIVLSFHDRYADDVYRVKERLASFRPNRFDTMTKDELTREFVHLLLMRLDRTVLDLDEDDAQKEEPR